MSPCLTLGIIRCISRVKWSNSRKGVAPFPTPQCSSYWKGNIWATLDYSRQLYLLISTLFSSVWLIDKTLSSATTPGRSGPRSNVDEGVLHISQSSSITGTSPLDCLVSYLGHSLWWWWWGAYLSAKKQLVYSTAPADWASHLKLPLLPHNLDNFELVY